MSVSPGSLFDVTVAQLVVHVALKPKVRGSTPGSSQLHVKVSLAKTAEALSFIVWQLSNTSLPKGVNKVCHYDSFSNLSLILDIKQATIRLSFLLF